MAIFFLWLGCALMYVAFHPLQVEGSADGPRSILRSLQAAISGQDSAFGAAAGAAGGGVVGGLGGLAGSGGSGGGVGEEPVR